MKSSQKLIQLLDQLFAEDKELEEGDKGYTVEKDGEYTNITITNVAHDQHPTFVFENNKFAYIDIT